MTDKTANSPKQVANTGWPGRYRGLPPLAGLCTMEEAMKPGLSVDECVRRLKRIHYAFLRLHEIFTARITAEPIYEIKMAFSLHAHLCAEQVAALRKRVGELREPPLGMEVVPDENLEIFFDEIRAAGSTEELTEALYALAIPALEAAVERYLWDTHPLVDHPSVRLFRIAQEDLETIATFGRQAVDAFANDQALDGSGPWEKLLDDCLAAAGSLDGVDTPDPRAIVRQKSATPFVYDRTPRRDERFKDPYNMGVNAEVFLYDEHFDPAPKTLMMFYKRLREIDVPEMMASIIVETSGKPWEYYQDMTRQLWDEARHAMMGEIGFSSLGIDWRKVPVNFTWSLGLNTQLSAIERHAVLYFIERGLMPSTGKRFEWEVAVASHNPLSALFQDFDWADEVLHSRIGRQWYVSEFKNTQQAIDYGDQCWSRVLVDWNQWREQGLTGHRNWWPEIYQEACARWGIDPDPEVLAYSESYESKRADLKMISG